MADAMDSIDDSTRKTALFVDWLAHAGVHLSPSISITDLRTLGKGRGVGKLFLAISNR
jgi:hypothetical protein